jgi:hypothetical protein
MRPHTLQTSRLELARSTQAFPSWIIPRLPKSSTGSGGRSIGESIVGNLLRGG